MVEAVLESLLISSPKGSAYASTSIRKSERAMTLDSVKVILHFEVCPEQRSAKTSGQVQLQEMPFDLLEVEAIYGSYEPDASIEKVFLELFSMYCTSLK